MKELNNKYPLRASGLLCLLGSLNVNDDQLSKEEELPAQSSSSDSSATIPPSTVCASLHGLSISHYGVSNLGHMPPLAEIFAKLVDRRTQTSPTKPQVLGSAHFTLVTPGTLDGDVTRHTVSLVFPTFSIM